MDKRGHVSSFRVRGWGVHWHVRRGHDQMEIPQHRHWDADGRGSPHCISWYQNQLILTTCHVRYHIALWDIGASDSSDL